MNKQCRTRRLNLDMHCLPRSQKRTLGIKGSMLNCNIYINNCFKDKERLNEISAVSKESVYHITPHNAGN